VGRLMNDNFVPLSQVAQGRYSAKFTAAIDRALKVKPEERTQSIAELRHELGLDTMAPPPRPASSRAPAQSGGRAAASDTAPRSKLPMLVGGGVLGLAVLGGGL